MGPPVIFKHGFMIDGNGGEPVENATLVVDGKYIQKTGAPADKPADKIKEDDSRVIDLKGKTIMPGLMDAHIHAGNIELTLDKTACLPPAVYVHRTSNNLARDLQSGFTSVRDAGGLDGGFRSAANKNLISSPRLFLSVTPLSKADDHTRGKADKSAPPVPRNSIGVLPEICHEPEDIKKAVERTIERQADQIKVFADGEVVSQDPSDQKMPGQCTFSGQELKIAVKTANRLGSYVMAHTYCPEAILNCLQAGVRSIEHGNLMDAESARMMANENAFYVPTLTIYDAMSREGKTVGLNDYTIEKLNQVAFKGLEALELAYKAGVKIGSGSDAIGPFQNLKGRELLLKSEVMSPMEAIISATRTNAELMRISDRLGTLGTGKIADIIVVDGNPLKDLSLFENGLKNVVLVMKEGVITKNLLK